MKKKLLTALILAAALLVAPLGDLKLLPVSASSNNSVGTGSGNNTENTNTGNNTVSTIIVSGFTTLRPNYVYDYEVTHAAGSENNTVTWYSENEEIAEVISCEGLVASVRGVTEGVTKIVAVSSDGSTCTVDVTVTESAPPSTSIIASDFDAIKEALEYGFVTTLEYKLENGESIAAEEQQEIFSSIQGTGKEFSFAFENGNEELLYKWTFQGNDITDVNKVMEFQLDIDMNNAEITANIEDGIEELDLHFLHQGTFPGPATLSVNVNGHFTTDNLYLYFYNPNTKKLELIDENVSVIDGYAVFPLNHCSDYILTAEMLRNLVPVVTTNPGNTETKVEKTVATTSPKTGDNSMMLPSLILVCAGMIFILLGKKKVVK